MRRRVVFETAVVVSALILEDGAHSRLRRHWTEGGCAPLLSPATAAKLTRALGDARFGLSAEERRELLGEYLPYCEVIEKTKRYGLRCREAADQAYLDLAESGRAEVLVSGNPELLALDGQAGFSIVSAEGYLQGPGLGSGE